MKEKKIPLRNEVKEKDKWDLSTLYKSESEWEKDYELLKKEIDEYSKFRGNLSKSIDFLISAIEFDLSFSRRFEKLYTYAHLKSDEDKTNSKYFSLVEKSMILHTKASSESSFLNPEIQSLPEDRKFELMKNSKYEKYKFYFEELFRYKPHTRSIEVEEILAMGGDAIGAASDIFSQLDNADLNFGIIENEKGEKIELSHGNFNSCLQSRDRSFRKRAFEKYYSVYDAHKHTIATSFSSSVKKDKFYANVRNFNSCREASLFANNVNPKVYDSLISAVTSNIDPLVKYLNFRKKVLGLDDLHFYDTYLPLVSSVNFTMSYEEGVQTCCEALEILGEEYVSTLRKGLLEGWVDRYENRGKRSGAYSSGCYDSYPYILLNYDENNINSLFTLIHEAGHSMHTHYSKTQPYMYSSYSIFVAEVASTFNEVLLSNYLLQKFKNDNSMTSYILNRQIDDIRGTMIRQTMFAEFEDVMHKFADRDEPISLELIRSEYRTLLSKYFKNGIVIDDLLELEALRIPHFYSAFYVYQYATGISAAISLAKKVLSGDKNSKSDYLKFLSLGGSVYPVDGLKIAGVDMTQPEPVNNAVNYFGELVDKFISNFSFSGKS
ncbi:MAG: oligoendopeptidase F [Leptospiraceae bacterium]|nr:oligoendopeptidase F [Leptospiraceae bacterium]MCK6382250.1 oligoendopeptidase F [Leptospiraceae bacterium]NUM40681.1 oligoendopeptidase F [Leptospiraceae bacterium]